MFTFQMPAEPQKLPWKVRMAARRNRLFANPRCQHWAAKLPLINWIARTRAREAFDVLAGFSYSQILRAFVESGLFDILADGPITHANAAAKLELSHEAARTLLRAGRALGADQWRRCQG